MIALRTVLLMLVAAVIPAAYTQQPVDLVNVLVGTAAEGQTFPAAGVPFAMTQWTPQTRAGETKCVAPYYYADTGFQGFRGSHFLSGSCAQDYGSFTVMPLSSDTVLDPAARAARLDHAHEHATPYLYTVELADSGIRASVTGTLRAGLMEFRFPPGKPALLAIDNNVRLGQGTLRIDPARQEVSGENPVYRIYAGDGQPAGFSGEMILQFDQPFQVGGTFGAGQRQPGATEVRSAAPGVYLHFPPGCTLHVRVGTSFTSLEQARRNLAAELPSFDFAGTVERARAAWNQALAPVEVSGTSPDRRILYTALFHSMLLPRVFSDSSGTYPSFARTMTSGVPPVQTAQGWTYYGDFSVWDTFRALHPLLALLDPARDGEMVRSLVAKGEQGGFLPIFPAWNTYTSEMTGDHAGAILTDAYVKGIRGFDAEAAYRLMRRNATEEPASRELYRLGEGRRALPSYLKYGYIPLEDPVADAFHGNEQVSRTLDYAFDDFELSVLARELGHTADAQEFTRRAGNWRNVIDPAVGFARGRHADGSWVTPFNPVAPISWITESTPYVDTFSVPQDIPGLIQWLGGPARFVAKLDGVFTSGAYDQGNEPSHDLAYLYDAAGAPGRTQFHVHDLVTRLYRDEPGGLAGNDDAGQMSAWYVFSALGFYPVTPGVPRYALGTPHFDDVRLHLPGGHMLHIRAPGAESGSFYVRSITLNGRPLTRPWLLHSELLAGGELVFSMSRQEVKPSPFAP